MVTFLTWNLKNIDTELKRSVIHELVNPLNEDDEVDVFLFQECWGRYVNVLLDSKYDEMIYPGRPLERSVRIFVRKERFDYLGHEAKFNGKLLFVSLQRKGKDNERFNLAGVHLYSKLNNTERKQLWKNLPIFKQIEEYENSLSGSKNTIVAGDFNYNPFEKDFLDPLVLNAVESKEIISMLIGNTVIEDTFAPLRKNNFWYNPMWNLLGDYDYCNKTPKPSGTYFRYTDSEHVPIWNMFDGFLLRSDLMGRVNYEASEIIYKTKSTDFLKPLVIRSGESLIKEDLSDHLPVKFALNIN